MGLFIFHFFVYLRGIADDGWPIRVRGTHFWSWFNPCSVPALRSIHMTIQWGLHTPQRTETKRWHPLSMSKMSQVIHVHVQTHVVHLRLDLVTSFSRIASVMACSPVPAQAGVRGKGQPSVQRACAFTATTATPKSTSARIIAGFKPRRQILKVKNRLFKAHAYLFSHRSILLMTISGAPVKRYMFSFEKAPPFFVISLRVLTESLITLYSLSYLINGKPQVYIG